MPMGYPGSAGRWWRRRNKLEGAQHSQGPAQAIEEGDVATHHRESPQKAAPPPGTEHYYVTLTLTRLVITVMYCELVGRGW